MAGMEVRRAVAALLSVRFRSAKAGVVLVARVQRGRRRFPSAEVHDLAEVSQIAKLLAAAAGVAQCARAFSAQMRSAWLLRQRQADAAAESASEDEGEAPALLDEGAVVRPEQFCLSDGTAGLCVPVTVAGSDGNRGEWRLYLRRAADGRRECLPLPLHLEFAPGSRVWFDPVPSAPAAQSDPRWSRQSREAWVGGASARPRVEWFGELASALHALIDFSCPGGPKAESWAALVAAWITLTYSYSICDTVPYLLIGGAPASGKTRLLELIASMCFRPLVTSNITGASLFRTVHDRGGTLLLDEAEDVGTAGGERGELRNVLLAGYRRFGRCTRMGEAGATDFCVFGPKAIAAINHPGPVLASRCVPLTLLRRPAEMGPLPGVREYGERLMAIRDELHVEALGGLQWDVRRALDEPKLCEFSGRASDVWGPLLAVAAAVDGGLAGTVRSAVLEVAFHCLATHVEERLAEGDVLVLCALRQLVRQGREPTANEILVAAERAEPDSVRGWTPRRVGEALRRYGLETVRTNGRRRYRGLSDETFAAIERRFGAEIPPLNNSAAVQVGSY